MRVNLSVLVTLAAAFAQPRPQDAVRGPVRSFDKHSVVIAGEAHWLAQTRDLHIGLVRDPEFQAKVNDIVIEFGSRQSQATLDRYIAGEVVPFAELARVWRDTTKVPSWESPVYQEWLAAIRDVNRKLPADRRLRVLAGDSPIDWSKMKTQEAWNALGENNISFAQVINQQVDQHRKVFVVLGGNHVTKNGDRNHDPDTTTRVELKHPLDLCGPALRPSPDGELESSVPLRTEGLASRGSKDGEGRPPGASR